MNWKKYKHEQFTDYCVDEYWGEQSKPKYHIAAMQGRMANLLIDGELIKRYKRVADAKRAAAKHYVNWKNALPEWCDGCGFAPCCGTDVCAKVATPEPSEPEAPPQPEERLMDKVKRRLRESCDKVYNECLAELELLEKFV